MVPSVSLSIANPSTSRCLYTRLKCLIPDSDAPLSPSSFWSLFRAGPCSPAAPISEAISRDRGAAIWAGQPCAIADPSSLRSSSLSEQCRITFSATDETNMALCGSAANLARSPLSSVQNDASTDSSGRRLARFPNAASAPEPAVPARLGTPGTPRLAPARKKASKVPR
jgi:hypothetical protein